MKKIKRITIKRPMKRRKDTDQRVKEAFANVPKITNETVAEHREDVLKGARKYIYPLKHSRRRAVTISSSIFITAIVIFMAYVGVSLYRLQSTSGFLYGVTKVIPFPVAKTGSSWVSYNSYLFELRRYTHYYETQQGADFNGNDKAQFENYKKQAMQQVIDDARVKQLAKQNGVRITDRQVQNQVELVRSQNRLGTSQQEFEEVLNEFWGWNVNDFKRSLKQQMLAQAVVAKLDTQTTAQANDALQKIRGGADFAALASQVSQDQGTKANGGRYNNPVERGSSDVSSAVLNELFKLQPGQTSAVINTGFSLEIVKVDAIEDDKIKASHISFDLKPISEYLAPLQKQQSPHRYINV